MQPFEARASVPSPSSDESTGEELAQPNDRAEASEMRASESAKRAMGSSCSRQRAVPGRRLASRDPYCSARTNTRSPPFRGEPRALPPSRRRRVGVESEGRRTRVRTFDRPARSIAVSPHAALDKMGSIVRSLGFAASLALVVAAPFACSYDWSVPEGSGGGGGAATTTTSSHGSPTSTSRGPGSAGGTGGETSAGGAPQVGSGGAGGVPGDGGGASVGTLASAGGGTSTSAGGANAGGAGGGFSTVDPCPMTIPAVGDGCAVPTYLCEYADGYGDDVRTNCRHMFKCRMSTMKFVDVTVPDGACATFPDCNSMHMDGQSCTQTPEPICRQKIAPTQDEGLCECLNVAWQCDHVPVDPSCPFPYPNAGAPCTGNVSCTYGGACALPSTTVRSCVHGYWVAEDVPNCP